VFERGNLLESGGSPGSRRFNNQNCQNGRIACSTIRELLNLCVSGEIQMTGIFKTKVSDERALTVYKDIARGSEPELRFYVLVAASTVIAVFGLIQNSTAVVIGAMLVAPLMTPIFGIALALVRSHASLLGRAIRAEIAGVILTILLGAGCGVIFPELQVTPEMLSRTSPTLLDLLVAIFAGLAGAYAMVDEHLSPPAWCGHFYRHRSAPG
jgi:hypothetical protein